MTLYDKRELSQNCHETVKEMIPYNDKCITLPDETICVYVSV